MGTQESILVPAALDRLVGRAVEAIDRLDLGGRRLAVMGENTADILVAHLGALTAGVSSVPVARYLGAAEVAYILADSGAGALLASGRTAEVAAKAAAQAGVPHLPLEDWLADPPASAPAPARATADPPAVPPPCPPPGPPARP